MSTTTNTTLRIFQTITIVIATLSFVASFTMALMIKKSKEPPSPYRRLIFGLSVADVMQSAALITGPFLSPSDSPGAIWAIGNTCTCNLNGLLISLGALSLPMYTFSLCLFALLRVKYRMTREAFAEKVEWKLHAFTWFWSLMSFIFPLYSKDINPTKSGVMCTIRAQPLHCDTNPDKYGECIRGTNATVYITVFFHVPLLLYFAGMTASLASLSWYVFVQESQILGGRRLGCCKWFKQCVWHDPIDIHSERTRSQLEIRVFSTDSLIQSSLYVIVFMLTYSSSFIFILTTWMTKSSPSELAGFLKMILFPCGGVLNILVYTRPKVGKFRQRHSEMSYFYALWQIVKAGGDIPTRFTISSDGEESESSMPFSIREESMASDEAAGGQSTIQFPLRIDSPCVSMDGYSSDEEEESEISSNLYIPETSIMTSRDR